MMTISPGTLSRQDLYGLRRAFVGLNTQELVGISPSVRMLLDNVDWKDPQQLILVKKMYQPILGAIIAIDPNGPPPVLEILKDKSTYVPPLPSAAALSDAALKASESVGGWYKEAVKWAKMRSPMTPHHFLESGMVWAIGLAVARRVCIQFHDRIFPHLYLLYIAETSKYAKSTGLKTVYSLIMAAMPHMLIPGNVTPEGFVEILSGQLPENFDKLGQRDQRLLEAGRQFAAQRGILMDEYSGLLASMKKDYMSGFVEMLMKLYDAGDFEPHYSKSTGLSVMKYPGISIIGATTPAALARASTPELWENGAYARYMMLFRDKPLPYTSDFIDPIPPKELVKGLLHLHTVLPKIASVQATEEEGVSKPFEPMFALMTEPARNAYMTYTKAVYHDMIDDEDLDERFHGNYKRLHVQGLKVALALACIDWARDGAQGPVTIGLGHWAIGQSMAETARDSLHRMMPVLNETAETKTTKSLVTLLKHYPEGITVRELSAKLGKKSGDVRSILEVLSESGSIEVVEVKHLGAGRPTVLYKLLE